MIDAPMIDKTLRRLDAMDSPTLRRDYLVTVQLAKRCINDLMKGEVTEHRRLSYIAKQISDRAAVKPVLVYRTLKTGEFRWQSAHVPSAARIRDDQIIGTYDEGADWRDILSDLQA